VGGFPQAGADEGSGLTGPVRLPGRPFLTTRDAAVLAVLCAEPPPAAAIQLKLERLRRRGLAGKRRRHGVRYYKKSA